MTWLGHKAQELANEMGMVALEAKELRLGTS